LLKYVVKSLDGDKLNFTSFTGEKHSTLQGEGSGVGNISPKTSFPISGNWDWKSGKSSDRNGSGIHSSLEIW